METNDELFLYEEIKAEPVIGPQFEVFRHALERLRLQLHSQAQIIEGFSAALGDLRNEVKACKQRMGKV